MDHQKRISDELWNGDTYDERIPDSNAEDLTTYREMGHVTSHRQAKMQSGVGTCRTSEESPMIWLTKVRG